MICPHCGGEVDCSYKQRQAQRLMQEQGMPVGRPPYGWQSVGKKLSLEPEPEEQRVLTLVKALRESGESLAGITKTLNHNGYRTRSGKPWVYQYVVNILKGRS